MTYKELLALYRASNIRLSEAEKKHKKLLHQKQILDKRINRKIEKQIGDCVKKQARCKKKLAKPAKRKKIEEWECRSYGFSDCEEMEKYGKSI